MRIACHYFEGKTIHPVTPTELKEESSQLLAKEPDASSSMETKADDLPAEEVYSLAILRPALLCMCAEGLMLRRPSGECLIQQPVTSLFC